MQLARSIPIVCAGAASFNTASGKYCCNVVDSFNEGDNFDGVSIPQAVSTVATKDDCILDVVGANVVSIPQAVSTVATKIIPFILTPYF